MREREDGDECAVERSDVGRRSRVSVRPSSRGLALPCGPVPAPSSSWQLTRDSATSRRAGAAGRHDRPRHAAHRTRRGVVHQRIRQLRNAGRRNLSRPVDTGVLRGKNLTSWPSLSTDIRNAGGTWQDTEAVTCPENGVDPGHQSQTRRPDGLQRRRHRRVHRITEIHGERSGAFRTGAAVDVGALPLIPASLWSPREKHELSSGPVGRAADLFHGIPAPDQF